MTEKPAWYHGYVYTLEDTDPRKEKYLKQLQERGFDETEMWSLDQTLTEIILPRLKRYKEVKNWVTDKEWDQHLDNAIEAFEILYKSYQPLSPFGVIQEVDYEKVKKGFTSLGEIFVSLWT